MDLWCSSAGESLLELVYSTILLVLNLAYFALEVSSISFLSRCLQSKRDSSRIPLNLHQENIHWFKPWKVLSSASLKVILICSQYFRSLQIIFIFLNILRSKFKCDNDLHQQKKIFHNHMTILQNQQDTSAGYKQDTSSSDTKLLKLNVLKRMEAVRS